ncbi:MAG: hypothetical protein KKF65_00085 [Nanoarchaeota archaeon]|nr:hypothetical protein [Nanoarchaeota archaeon]
MIDSKEEDVSKKIVKYPWLFKGAYATYIGTNQMKPAPGDFVATVKIDVEDIDLANNRVKLGVSTSMVQRIWKLTKKFGEKKIDGWINIGERMLPSATPVKLESEYEGFINVRGIGVRKCYIRQLLDMHPRKNIVSGAELDFWDKEFNWPLQSIIMFQYKTKTPESVWANALTGALNDMSKIIKALDDDPSKTYDNLFKRSENMVLRDASIILNITETNIPGLKAP